MDMSYNTLEDLDIGFFQELDQFVQNFDKIVENFIRLKIYGEELEFDDVEIKKIFSDYHLSDKERSSNTWEVTIYVRWGHPFGDRKKIPDKWLSRAKEVVKKVFDTEVFKISSGKRALPDCDGFPEKTLSVTFIIPVAEDRKKWDIVKTK